MKQLFFTVWYTTKYGSHLLGWDLAIGLRKNDKCAICGIEQTWPMNLVQFFTIAKSPINPNHKMIFTTYCMNHKDILPDDLVDCLTGEKVILPDVDKWFRFKYYCKKFALDSYTIFVFVCVFVVVLINWYVIFPIRKALK